MSLPVHLDLGCGKNKREISNYENIGIDIHKTDVTDHVVQLGFEPIPFDDNSVDLITAFDFLEHLPRVIWEKSLTHQFPYKTIHPFIDLMNEAYRVLKDDGEFIIECPFSESAFYRDPTHVNRLTEDWFHYFSKDDNYYADQGLVTCNFVLKQQMFRKYMWTEKDIIHTELKADKSVPKTMPTGFVNL